MLLLNCGFPQAKTLPAELNVHIPLPPGKWGALAADSSFGGPGSDFFGLEIVLLRKGVSSGHTFALEAVTSAPGNAQR